MKKLLLIATAAVGVFVFFLVTQRNSEVAAIPPELEGPVQDVGLDARAKAEADLRTANELRAISTNNPGFQTWGRTNMLRIVNEHLSRVPLYGLSGPLGESNTVVHAFLTTDGAELWLHSQDLKHRFRFAYGVLWEAVASEADVTGISRQPDKVKSFGENAIPWSDDQAKTEALRLAHASGLDLKALGASGSPKVTTETFDIPDSTGKVVPVTAFYTVTWRAAKGELILEMRFRSHAGKWEPTFWFNNTRRVNEMESNSYSSLRSRFF